MSDYPDVPPATYELRFTTRALADVGASGCLPGDMDDIRRRATWPAIVEKFASQRTLDPRGTEAPLDRMGVPDVYPLHGPAGQRAATWYDEALSVVWFLAFTPEHDYSLLEQRAASDILLPDEEDAARVLLDRENLGFIQRVGPGIDHLVAQAWKHPGQAQRGTVGGNLFRLDVTVEAVHVDGGQFGDVYISVRLPFGPGTETLDDWPRGQLLERIAEVLDAPPSSVDYAVQEVPDGCGGWRAVSHADEMALRLANIEL